MVLHRRAGQDDAACGLQLLDAARLRRRCILDRLGLVEHDQRPVHLRQPLLTPGKAVGRDHQVQTCEPGLRILGQTGELLGSALGTIEPGKLADLIVVAADPLQDITNLRTLRLVFKEGRLVADHRVGARRAD